METTLKIKRKGGTLAFSKRPLKRSKHEHEVYALRLDLDETKNIVACFSKNELTKILISYIDKKSIEFTRSAIDIEGNIQVSKFESYVKRMSTR